MNARENMREAIKEMLLDNNIGGDTWSETKWPSGFYGWISGAMIRDLLKDYDKMETALSCISNCSETSPDLMRMYAKEALGPLGIEKTSKCWCGVNI